MLLFTISNTINKCLPKTFNFGNPFKPCRKSKACKKTFTSYVARFKKFVDYETTKNVNLIIFHKKVFLLKLSIL